MAYKTSISKGFAGADKTGKIFLDIEKKILYNAFYLL